MSLFPRIPEEGESVEFENHTVEVKEVMNNRIMSIIFSPKFDEVVSETNEAEVDE